MEKSKLPVYYEGDIVVCGGGTAGVFAAIAAAEKGKDVIIIEQFGGLGGSATSALVTPIMSSHVAGNPQCSYISKKVKEKLQEYGGADITGAWFDPLLLKIVLEELCVKAGVKLLFHTMIGDVIRDGDKIEGVIIANKSGLSRVNGKLFIDATGDGDVSVFAGAEYTKGNPETGKNQPISLRYIVGGVDFPVLGEFFKEEAARTGLDRAAHRNEKGDIYAALTGTGEWILGDLFDKAIAAGDLIPEDKLYWQAFTVTGRQGSIAFNNPEFFDDVDGTNPDHLTKTQVEGKHRILRQLQFYKKYMKGFDNAYLAEIAPMVGVRESRNIQTEHVITAIELITRTKFHDAVCQSNYPVDIHGKVLDFGDRFKPVDDGKPYYEIPYRSLVVKGIDNLFVTGRCLGAEFLAQSAIRVQHSMRSVGEAAGIAAAFVLDKDILPRELDGKEVRAEMERLGAVFAD